MLKIWNGAFWREAGETPVPEPHRPHRLQTAVIGLLVAASLAAGLGAEAFLGASRAAADAAADRPAYIQSQRETALGHPGETGDADGLHAEEAR